MPCLVGLIAFFAPRLVILVLALTTHFFSRAYHSLIWPVLGFFFMPLTTLAYAAVIHYHGSVNDIYVVLVVVAALFDLGLVGGGGAQWRRGGFKR